MYLATILLALRRNRWGYFIGISAAGRWDYTNIFVSTFFVSGLRWLSAWMHTGHLKRVDQIIAVPAWTANFPGRHSIETRRDGRADDRTGGFRKSLPAGVRGIRNTGSLE
jgi:hypothetical protein